MSYYKYHKKLLLETDGKILFLALISDSSITTNGIAKNGRTYGCHPKSWAVVRTEDCGLFWTKNSLKNYQEKLVEEELVRIAKFNLKVNGVASASLDDECYSGTRYPAGRRIRDMRAFYSSRKTIDAKDFLKKQTFMLAYTAYDGAWNLKKSLDMYICDVDALIEANQKMITMAANEDRFCISVSGIPEEAC